MDVQTRFSRKRDVIEYSSLQIRNKRDNLFQKLNVEFPDQN